MKPDVRHLKVFGSVTFALIPSQKLRKLDDKSVKCILVGYCSGSKAYRLYNPATSKVFESRDVIIHENSRWKWEGSEDGPVILVEDQNNCEHLDSDNVCDKETSRKGGSSSSNNDAHGSSSSGESSEESPPRKTGTLIEVYNSCTYVLHVGDPQVYQDAMIHREWQEAMDTEMAAIRSNNTWELTELPSGKKAVGLKWVYKTKFGADGKIQKHKARIVAKGYVK